MFYWIIGMVRCANSKLVIPDATDLSYESTILLENQTTEYYHSKLTVVKNELTHSLKRLNEKKQELSECYEINWNEVNEYLLKIQVQNNNLNGFRKRVYSNYKESSIADQSCDYPIYLIFLECNTLSLECIQVSNEIRNDIMI
ncbi:hypothetical protein ECANGB1_1598 [Enterospora canceri]|uniref:Uncharacterized protein n=1 Tax=Enterospora canceri TaxID=1081671 RepID=A0A1Y1S5R2_9MICR|nr:hypothetical protein ECANGB1_1598 [Enterospora canceri]